MFRFAVAALILLAACAAPKPEPPPLPPADPTPGFNEREPDTCKAQSLVGLVGQGAGAVRTVRMPGPVRVIAPGQVVDQAEYRSDRVNVHVDAEGRITRLSCG